MPMTRARKEDEIGAIRTTLENSEVVVLTHNLGLNAKATQELRVTMREGGVQYKISKNTLTKRAAAGTRYEGLADMLKGPTGMATSADPVSAAKAAYEFSKKNDRFVILGGMMGDVKLDASAVEQLAKLPSLDELRSKIVGLLVAAPTKLAGVLQAPARNMVGVTKAYGEKA